MAIQKLRVVSEEVDVGQDPVLDKDLTTAPGSPSEGARYIIAGIGGSWSTGTINDIAYYWNSAWTFLTPTKGMEVYVDDEDVYYHWNGVSWEARATGGGGGGGGAIGTYQNTFVNGDLSSGILTVNHNLAEQYVETEIYDNNDKKINPDEVTLTNTNTLTIDLTTFGTISGTWTIIVIAGSSASLLSANGQTKIQVDETPGEDKIRFDIGGVEQVILEDGAYLPTTDNDVDLGSAGKKFKDLYLSGSSLHLDDLVFTKNKFNKVRDNISLLAFYRAIDQSIPLFNMVDSIVDEYEDESGVDTVASTNEAYDATDDFYGMGGGSIDADTKFLLHCNGVDESTTFTDETENHTVTPQANAQIDTAQYKFGGASGLFDGSNDYLSVPDSTDWDIIASNSDDWTIELWVKFTNPASTQYLLSQDDGGPNTWVLYHVGDGNGLQFSGQVSGSWPIATGQGGKITDTNWHHVAMCKVGSKYACYLDGVQSNYIDNGSTTTISGVLQIGARLGGNLFAGHMDEIRINHSNIFSALPNVGKTDTITVPTSEYGVFDNMTLISEASTADVQADSARIILFEEDISAITLNTDLKAYVSRDGGTTYTQATLSDEGDYETGKRILTGSVDISGQPSGTSMKYKIETLNNENLKLHGVGLSWD